MSNLEKIAILRQAISSLEDYSNMNDLDTSIMTKIINEVIEDLSETFPDPLEEEVEEFDIVKDYNIDDDEKWTEVESDDYYYGEDDY